MKPEKHQKNTPEESLRASCGKGMGLNLSYNEIRDRLDTTEIARVGKVRKAAKPAMIPTDAPTPAPRRAFPAVLLVLAVLILTPALAVGSFLIARSTMDPAPPDETVGDLPPLGTSPDQSVTPGVSTIVTPRPITPNTAGEAWGNIFNLTESYATENAMFLRAEHLDPAMTEGDLPAVLTINEWEEWQQFRGDTTLDITANFGVTAEDFFVNHSLQVIITEGRSGSIRYRLDGIYTDPGEKLTLELTAEVPPALTMDIAHWCVLVPIPKAAAELPVELALRDEPMWDVEAPDDVITDIMINPYQLWFDSDSYAKDGCLYGRLGYNSGWLYPYTKSVTTYAEWQSLYLGCSSGSVSDGGFTEGLAALDEAFFAEHSLAILYVEEGSGSYRHSVYDIRVEDGELKIGLATLKPEIGTCDMAYWAVLVPIDKEYGDLPVFITK